MGIIQGGLDIPLNATGLLQASVLAKALPPVYHFDLIYTSDLVRAHDTAKELVRSSTLISKDENLSPKIQTDVRLRERTLGSLDGKHVSIFLDQCRKVGLRPDEFTPEGGESGESVRQRVIDFIQSRVLEEVSEFLLLPGLEQQKQKTQKKVLLVSHGATIREMIKYFASFGHSSWASVQTKTVHSIPPNTSVNEFAVHLDLVENGQSRLKVTSVEVLRLHDVTHLSEEMRSQAHYQQKVNVHTV